ncbi:MAG: hypothetical protein ABI945_05040 [Nitrospirales bacterium]
MTIPNYAIRVGSIAMTIHGVQCLVMSRARGEESPTVDAVQAGHDRHGGDTLCGRNHGWRTVPMQESPPNIVDIKHVTVYRGDTEVLTDFSLEIPLGCHTAILGPTVPVNQRC